jgi:hypothetical protein
LQPEESASQKSDSDSNQEYEVDFIEGHKITKDNKRIEFYVRWKNYSSRDNTWESFDFFAQDAPGMA